MSAKAPFQTKLGPAIFEILSVTTSEPYGVVYSDSPRTFTVNGVEYGGWRYHVTAKNVNGRRVWQRRTDTEIHLERTKWVRTTKIPEKAQDFVFQMTWPDVEKALAEDAIVQVILKEYDGEIGFRRQKQLSERITNLEKRIMAMQGDLALTKEALVASLRNELTDEQYNRGVYGK